MPIEIRCPKCQKLLRVPDTAAGKQARCPECQEVVSIPTAEAAAASASSFPPESSANPFGEAAAPSKPADAFKPAADPTNPYAASGFYEQAPASEGVLAHDQVTFNDLSSATMQIFQVNAGPLVIVGVLVFATHAAISLVSFGINFGVGITSAMADSPILAIFGTILLYVFQFLTYPIPTLGALICCLKLLRQGHTTAGDFFALGRFYGTTLLRNLVLLPIGLVVAVVFGLLVFALGATKQEELLLVGVLIGYAFFLVAAYAVYLVLYISSFFIIDRGAGPIECMKLSMRYMQGNYLTVFLVTFVLFLVSLPLSICTCYFIWILLAPVFALVSALTYFAVTGQRGAIAPVVWGPTGPAPGWGFAKV